MTKVTIIADDKVVGVDGEFRKVDLSALDSDIHAVQWDGVNGHVEFRNPKRVVRISSIIPYQSFIDLWTAAAPPPPSPSPTDEELTDSLLLRSPGFRGLVRVVAENGGETEEQVVARIKSLSSLSK